MCRISQAFSQHYLTPSQCTFYAWLRLFSIHTFPFIRSFFKTLEHTNPVLPSILVTATKYQADRLRQHVMAELVQRFPSQLEQFQDMDPNDSLFLSERDLWSFVTATVKAARASNATILLPAALLEACKCPAEYILADSGLDAADCLTILSGRDKLSDLARKKSLSAAFDAHPMLKCKAESPHNCGRVWSNIRTRCVHASNFFDPFFSYNSSTTHMPDNPSSFFFIARLCAECEKTCRSSHKSGTNEVWTVLPSVFGLPEWSQLSTGDSDGRQTQT